MLESGICGLLEAETTLSSKTLLVGCLSVCLSVCRICAGLQARAGCVLLVLLPCNLSYWVL